MTTPTSTRSLRAGTTTAEGFADEALQATSQAFDSTRQLATEALEKAGEKARELRMGVKDLAHKGLTSVSDATVSAQKQVGRYADATGRYVSEQPLKSALIAAGVGAFVAALIIAARKR